jgi:hypothetical protein
MDYHWTTRRHGKWNTVSRKILIALALLVIINEAGQYQIVLAPAMLVYKAGERENLRKLHYYFFFSSLFVRTF